MSREKTSEYLAAQKMVGRAAYASSEDDVTEPSAERDLLSLARLLHYTKCEAEALGQTAAAALVDAALLSLSASTVEGGTARGKRLQGLLADQPAPPQTRKFC